MVFLYKHFVTVFNSVLYILIKSGTWNDKPVLIGVKLPTSNKLQAFIRFSLIVIQGQLFFATLLYKKIVISKADIDGQSILEEKKAN